VKEYWKVTLAEKDGTNPPLLLEIVCSNLK